jgi:diguanylate cyclase (GGDEF)-like protein/PAS domain S-box-containing protein
MAARLGGGAVGSTLRDSEARYRLLADSATDMIVRLDLDGTRTYVSPACRALLGYEPAQLEGISTFAFVYPADLGIVQERMRLVVEGHRDQRGRNRVIRADGRVIWVEANLRLVRDPATGAPCEIVSVVRDVTEQQENEARIEQLAATDILTGLLNRRAFLGALDTLLARGTRCALLFIDVNNFKPVNDIHGHSVGDAVLVELAARLRQVAPAGALVSRIGGDEFVMLLPGATEGGADAAELARQVLGSLALPVTVDGITAELGASIGISRSPDHGRDADTLLRTADMAMYHAKRMGSAGHLFFTSNMEEELRERAVQKLRLRHAVAAGEITPFYQPLIDLRSQRPTGLEVLARWRHPKRGILLPSEFIANAERGGLIGGLFCNLLRQACRDARQWPGRLTLAVNISPQQLQDTRLSGAVLDILQETGFDPRRLELEVTESVVIRDMPTAKGILGVLRAAGIRIALDDFGTGYASLRMVKELQVDRLKIDRSFVAALPSAPESGRYVSAIIGLARALGLATTAEGIEDAETMRRIAAMGCDLGQGYFFGTPQPAPEVGLWLARLEDGLVAGDAPLIATRR